ncbi:MAG: SPFH domain-containing protein [Oscillospiraceae bacterium]|nr:SPFH domain-containing protein [Oscillospiraceae bacterium]
MSRFVIECPRCGKYAEAKTGFFARKKIECSCGNTINVRTDRIRARQCPHCGNVVAFDQAKGAEARCPVCGTPINTLAEQSKYVEFSCVRCGVRLSVVKGREREQKEISCPICDFTNNVPERLMAEKIKREGRASIIKFEGDNEALVWKHPVEDFNYGSQLVVSPSQEAICIQNGIASEPLGAGAYLLETQVNPGGNSYGNSSEGSGRTIHSQVYFINKSARMAIRWGTSDKVRFLDPLTSTPLELGASGEMNLRVKDSRKLLLKLVGTMKGISWEDGPGMAKSLQNSFRPMITASVKTNMASVIKENAIDLLEIDEHLGLISERLREKLIPGFEEYGLTIPQFYVTNVVLPEEDINFRTIREIHSAALKKRAIETAASIQTVQAESDAAVESARRGVVLEQQATETEIARHKAQRRVIEAQAEAQAAHMIGMTEAEVMAAAGVSKKDVLHAEVQKEYAGALGKMGAGGSGLAGDMLGLGVGMAAANAFGPKIGSFINGEPANAAPAISTAPVGGWDCPRCGNKKNQSPFCPLCGAKKPEPKQAEVWDCPSCGAKGIDSPFCPRCGRKKPEPNRAEVWDCPSCGAKGIDSPFCPQCGMKKPEAPKGWTCPSCGKTGIMSKFCPECGSKRNE